MTTKQNLTDSPPRTLFTVNELVQLPEFAFLSKNSLRHLIFNSQSRFSASGKKIPGNGLIEAGAIIRIGRKILIDSHAFRKWTQAQTANITQ